MPKGDVSMKIDLQEVLAEGREFHGLKPREVIEKMHSQFFF